jgi:hypothetical protein
MDRPPETVRGRNWLALAALLLVWNCLAATHTSPMTLLQTYDSPQYHLLARNRLHGHFETADTGHTVRREGAHPMWRPGLVWLIEGLAGLAGSVRLAAALASALGTTFLELAMLWLTRRCFGVPTCVAVFLCVVSPLTVSTQFLRLAVGAGPEPWATAFILVGLAGMVEALRRKSLTWAAAAGLAAGLSEWFRTGNLIMLAVPCFIYALAGILRRDRVGFAVPVLTALGFMLSSTVGAGLVSSEVDKTTANLWGSLVEAEGPQVTKEVPVFGLVRFHVGGLVLAPGTTEAYYDYLVRRSREVGARDYFLERSNDLLPLYFSRLASVASTFAWGLRLHTGEIVLGVFLGQLVVSLFRRGREDVHVLAIGSGAAAFFLGPIVLLRGDEPTQYVLVMVPLMIPVAARGVIGIGQLMLAHLKSALPGPSEHVQKHRRPLLVLAAAPAVCLSLAFYQGALSYLENYEAQGVAEQADLDALHLEGRTVACRNMSWFVDRDVDTLLFPYATVPELESYARANKMDGILVWEHEPSLFFYATPYHSFERFDEAMRTSRVFDPPRVSGAWRWYPVRGSQLSRRGQ